MRRRAFTLTELLIGTLIMAITAGVLYLNSNTLGRQTAKREAERAAAYLQTHISRTDMMQDVLWITITPDDIELKAGNFTTRADYDNAGRVDGISFDVSKGCSFQNNLRLNNLRLVYPKNAEQKLGLLTFQPLPSGSTVKVSTGTEGKYYIIVNGADGKECNVLIGDQ